MIPRKDTQRRGKAAAHKETGSTKATGPREPQQLQELQEQLAQAQVAVQEAQERERRALADYQNVIRRQQGEREQLVRLSNRALLEDLMQPLDHLQLAARQLNDSGLQMAMNQLWQTLDRQGLERIEPEVGQAFDLELMEAQEREGKAESARSVQSAESEGSATRDDSLGHDGLAEDDDPLTVTALISPGYRLNGIVLKHAKVRVA